MSSQPASGGKTLVMSSKKNGPNWVMIAGSAIVMAVGIVIGRKQVQCQVEQPRIRSSKDGTAQISTTTDFRASSSERTSGSYGVSDDSDAPLVIEQFDDNFSSGHSLLINFPNKDSTRSNLSWKAPRVRTSLDSSRIPVSFQPQFELHSPRPKRSHPSKPSSPESKMCRQIENGTSCDEEFHSDSFSSPALRAGLAVRRKMVQRLRKQLRSRDAIIFDLQDQISDQDHVIAMHRAHTADLQVCLNSTNVELLKVNLEVQKVLKEIRIQSENQVVNIGGRDGCDGSGQKKQLANSDLKAVMFEAKMLSKKVRRLQTEKQEMESQVQAVSRDYEFLFRKASALEADRVQLKKLAHEKRHMLEVKEQECIKLTTALGNLQRNLDTETRDSDWTRNSEVSRLSEACSDNSRGTWSDCFDQPVSCNTPDDYNSRSPKTADSDNRLAGDCMRSYNTLFRRSPSPLHSEGSVSKPGSRSTALGCTSKSVCDGSPNYDGPNCDNDDTLSLNLVWILQQEVYQLSDALASSSKLLSQQKLETSRILTEYQKCNSTKTAQETRTALLSELDEYGWEDLLQILSSPDGTPSQQIQELSHKLEKVAKQQKMEDELEALSRHHVKIRALKSSLSKLTAKCHAEMDESSNESVHRVAGMILDLSEKLAVQEDEVRKASMDIQELSMSLQLSSPYVPRSKKQELRRMLHGCSGQAESPICDKNIPSSPGLSSGKSNFVAQEHKESRSSRVFDRQMSFSSLPRKSASISPSPEKAPDKLYEFQAGTFDPLSSTKTRKSANLVASKSSLRKSTMHQFNGIARKWDACFEKPDVQQRSHAVCYTPEEVPSGFSFRPANIETLGNPDDNSVAEDASNPKFEPGGFVLDSEDFQFRPEVQVVSEHETITAIGTQHADTYSSAPAISHSQSTMLGSATAGCGSRNSLRRFLFKPDDSSRGGYSTDTVVARNEDLADELEKLPFNSERKCDYVTDDANSEVQIKRHIQEDSPPVLVVSSNSARIKHDICSGPGSAGVSPFAARMACLDVNRSSHSFTSPHGDEGVYQEISFLSQGEEAEKLASHVDSKLNIGKENLRSNAAHRLGGQSAARMMSSKGNWEQSQAMAGKDTFRCDRGRWNSFQGSHR